MDSKMLKVSFTIFAQHGHADAWVTELDERRAALWLITLSGQQQIFGTYVSMNEVLLFLQDN